MTMMIAQGDAVEALGQERLAILKTCVDEAWQTFDETVRPIVPLCSPTGTANILRELLIQQVRERFVGVSGVNIHDRNVVGGRFLAEIDQQMILSFKKLTKDFHTSNYPTDTAQAFDKQEPGLEGMPDVPRITVGYQLGQFGTSLSGVFLAFVVGKECVWHYDLQSGSGSIEIDFPREEESAADKERKNAARKNAARRTKRAQGTDGAALSNNRDDDDRGDTDGG